MGAMPASAILSRKGIARCGGVSRTRPLRMHASLPAWMEKNLPSRPRIITLISRSNLSQLGCHACCIAGKESIAGLEHYNNAKPIGCPMHALGSS